MSVNVSILKIKNLSRWHDMHIKATRLGEFTFVARALIAYKNRYEQIEAATKVPWYIIAVIHEREASRDFSRQLAQGDPLYIKSVHAPAGRGPFLNHPEDPTGHDAFFRGALDALIDCPPYAAKWGDWTIGGALTLLEEYNGLGYAARGTASPYVWSGTDQYVTGKYVRDGYYDPRVVDQQLGCAALIATMMALDSTIRFDEGAIA